MESNDAAMSMEELLHDPKTTWGEIRTAMKLKSQGHATNGGIMMALVTDEAPVLRESTQSENPHEIIEMATQSEDDDLDSSFNSSGQLENVAVNFGYKPRTTRKPAVNNPRRGFKSKSSVGSSGNRAAVSSSITSNTHCSVTSSLASVDMMDFGVDNTEAVMYSMDTLQEIESRRATICSTANDEDENSSYPTNGFLDWQHDDESSANEKPTRNAVFDESCPGNNEADEPKNRLATAEEHGKKERQESWHIEDHDFEPEKQKPVVSKMFRRISSGTVGTVSTLLSRLSMELGGGASCDNIDRNRSDSQEATTDEVKRALSSNREKYRRYSTRMSSCDMTDNSNLLLHK